MVQDQNPKLWRPARFSHGRVYNPLDEPFTPDTTKQHAVIILNNPLENISLLVDVWIKGIDHVTE